MNVVVAHPSPDVRRELSAPLEQFGFGVIEAADPETALATCRETRPEVALIHADVALDWSGVALLDELKGDPEAFATAVVLIAGQGVTMQTAQEELRRGAQDLLLEPVMPVELLARVRSAARTKILQEELVGQSRRLETMLHEDPLTGLFNRRYVLTRLGGLISGARRHGRPLSVAMVDIDHLKRVNDAHGHDAGDAALVGVAIALRDRLRAEDQLGRLGGEEFLALLPDVDESAAATVSEKARAKVEALHIQIDELELSMTVSVGWATWDGEEDADGLVRRTEKALYEAKDAGRNTVRGGQSASASLRRRT
ncbi:MAG TPA: diguanylate cyclase [Solirubrobacteraceae bacterium]|nr:diguanylate cyclase [Solirubrobacteraceae bacterium]